MIFCVERQENDLVIIEQGAVLIITFQLHLVWVCGGGEGCEGGEGCGGGEGCEGGESRGSGNN